MGRGRRILRRTFLALGAAGAGGAAFSGIHVWRRADPSPGVTFRPVANTSRHLGVGPDGRSRVALARDAGAADNLAVALQHLGGIGAFVRPGDIVVLKPNAQWWAQGTSNTDAMAAFIEAALALPGFTEAGGEIIVAENHHFPERNGRGWTTERRNGRFNLNELVAHFQGRGHPNVTKVHWHDGGPSKPGTWGGAENGGLVSGPEEGDGYVWLRDRVWHAPTGRRCMMSYPVFTSPFSGIRLDLRRGPWKDGAYLKGRRLRLINVAALNHHGHDTGITASIKNYMGITDLTCGYRGTRPEGFWNVHFVAQSTLHWRVKEVLKKVGWKERFPMLGACLAYFMKTVRFADLNIITAEWVGVGSRTDDRLRAPGRAVLASVDPVALDYIAAKRVLMPATRAHPRGAPFLPLNDPDREGSPTRRFLLACQMAGIGNIDPARIDVLEARAA